MEGNAEWSNETLAETVLLREGVSLILSDFPPGSGSSYYFNEPEDYVGIGFHLKGGSSFNIAGKRFATRPFEVIAAAAPMGSTSSFTLSPHGFRTASIRFTPAAAQAILQQQDTNDAVGSLVAKASEEPQARRLPALDRACAAIVEGMFDSPYTGAARSLHLESCALALLAAQIGADPDRTAQKTLADRRLDEARAYLDAHLEDPPSIVELALICGLNDFKLKRDFKANYGTTIFGYVRQRRMEQAAADLHAGLSVAEAAAHVGYSCPRSFADAFRKHFGMLPSAVTRRALSDAPAHRT